MPKLVFLNKNFEEQRYELILEKTTVGRGNHNTLVICDNSVSMTHCEILMNGPEIIVRDLDSSNGTFIDRMRLNKQAQAKSGQTIRFGQVEARLELDEPTHNEHETNVTAVYDLAEYQRRKRREDRKKHPSPAGKVEPSVIGTDTGSQTVLMPRPPQPQFSKPDTVLATESESRPGRSKTLIWVIGGLVLLSLLLYLFWRSQ